VAEISVNAIFESKIGESNYGYRKSGSNINTERTCYTVESVRTDGAKRLEKKGLATLQNFRKYSDSLKFY
tara:strand:- start:1438 stop:1647 length:210 start_codon:yes stop_codon:yes gene_type:complete